MKSPPSFALVLLGLFAPLQAAAKEAEPEFRFGWEPAFLVSEPRSSEVDLRWAAPPFDLPVAGYEVLQGETVLVTVAAPFARIGGLRGGVEHCFTIRAVDAAGNRSTPAGPICATPPDETPPSAPPALTASPQTEAEVELRWSPASDEVEVAGYELFRERRLIATTRELGFIESGLHSGSKYCYTVIAFDLAGNRSRPAGPACASTVDVTPPSEPGELEATSEGDRAIRVRWKASRDEVGVARYVVGQYLAAGEGNPQVGSVVTTAPIATLGGLLPGKRYCFSAVALDAAENVSTSARPACAMAVDLTPPSVPEGLAAVALSSSRIELSWKAATDDVTVAGYELLRKGGPVRDVKGLGARDAGLRARTEYCYAVRAYDAAGNRSMPSAQVCVRTAAPDQPTTPAGLTVRASGDEQVLRWEPSETAGAVYTVYWQRLGDRVIGTTPLTTFKIFGPAAREPHCYSVSARARNGRESARSLPACVNPGAAK